MWQYDVTLLQLMLLSGMSGTLCQNLDSREVRVLSIVLLHSHQPVG